MVEQHLFEWTSKECFDKSGHDLSSVGEVDLTEVDAEVAAEDGDPLQAGDRLADRKLELHGLASVLAEDRDVLVTEVVGPASWFGFRYN